MIREKLMHSPDSSSGTVTEKTVLLLCAAGIGALEYFAPRIPLFPWLKPGLANAVTIVWLLRYGYVDTVMFLFLRVWIVGFFFGFSFFTSVLGLSGGLAAATVMATMWRLLGQKGVVGLMGMSVTGAVLHNLTQLGVVYLLMDTNPVLFRQIPIMVPVAAVTGSIVAILAKLFYDSIDAVSVQPNLRSRAEMQSAGMLNTMVCIALLIGCMALAPVRDFRLLGGAALAISIAVQFVEKGSLRAFFFPVTRFWMMFVFIGAFHLFFTMGTRIPHLPFATIEGLNGATAQWLKLWTWLQATFIFRRFGFHLVAFRALHRLFKNKESTLMAGLLALEHFPTVVETARKEGAPLLKTVIRKPSRAVTKLLELVSEIMTSEPTDLEEKNVERGPQGAGTSG